MVSSNKQKGSEYDQEIPQSHTADQPRASRRRATEHPQQQHTCKTTTAKQPASLPPQDDRKPRMDTK